MTFVVAEARPSTPIEIVYDIAATSLGRGKISPKGLVEGMVDDQRPALPVV